MEVYVALDNGVASYTPHNWMPEIIENEYRKARHSKYYELWYAGLSQDEQYIADDIAMRL